MGINVVGAILGIVFEHENGGIVPIRTVRQGLNYPADSQVVVGHRSRRGGKVFEDVRQFARADVSLKPGSTSGSWKTLWAEASGWLPARGADQGPPTEPRELLSSSSLSTNRPP